VIVSAGAVRGKARRKTCSCFEKKNQKTVNLALSAPGVV
jgi:hypothetical protein